MNAERISKIAIVDDQPQSRKSYSYTIENADFDVVPEAGPLGSLDDYLGRAGIHTRADAALCDFELGARAYANFTGAELVAKWYRQSFPALLCTRYEKAQIERIRPHRRWIPVLIKPDELTVDSFVAGLDRCLQEINGSFQPERRPWRTQIHFMHSDKQQQGAYIVEVPGWELDEVVRIRLKDIPDEVASRVRSDYRCHARVNLGAETAEELYICDWEVA